VFEFDINDAAGVAGEDEVSQLTDMVLDASQRR
jgi:hypothetical protein